MTPLYEKSLGENWLAIFLALQCLYVDMPY